MSAGFTLLESLVALAVLSLVVVATSQSLITSARSGALVNDKRAALAVARTAMESSLSGSASTPQGRRDGIAWQATRNAWPDPQVPGLVRLTVSAYPVADPQAAVTLETLIDTGSGR